MNSGCWKFKGGFFAREKGPFLLREPRTCPRWAWVPQVLIFNLILISCGPKRSEKEPPSAQLLPLLTSRERPQTYKLHDPGCQNRMELNTASLKLKSTWVRQTTLEGVMERAVDLTETETSQSLRSEAVSETSYGELYQRTCDFRKPKNLRCRDERGLELPFIREQSPGGLKVCQDGFQYPADSFEGVALTSMYGLDATYRYHREATQNKDSFIPKVSLLILPTFEEIYNYFPYQKQITRFRTYLTHNLAYFPEASEIVVFPESVLNVNLSSLWESPFVLSHEYGHHIDHTRHGHLYAQAGLKWSPLTHQFMEDSQEKVLGFSNSGADSPASPLVPPTMQPRALLTTALSEGFADLVAYYTQGESSASLRGFPDIGTDRDVSHAQFANGLPKVLKRDYLEVFFNQYTSRDRPSSDLSMMAGVHTIGAIIAFGTDQLITELANALIQGGSDGDIKSLKYRLLLSWMEAVVSQLAVLQATSSEADCLKSLDDGFVKMFDLVVKDIKITNDNNELDGLKSKFVTKLQDYFPALQP